MACRVLAIIALVMEVIGLILLVLLLLWIVCKWLVCSEQDDWCERCVYYAAPILFILSGKTEILFGMTTTTTTTMAIRVAKIIFTGSYADTMSQQV